MSCNSRKHRTVVMAVAAAAIASLAACDTTVTSPELKANVLRPASIQGDTLECTRGWHIVNGWYVCN